MQYTKIVLDLGLIATTSVNQPHTKLDFNVIICLGKLYNFTYDAAVLREISGGHWSRATFEQ